MIPCGPDGIDGPEHDYKFTHVVFTMHMEHDQFKFFMPCHVCTNCNHRISGTLDETMFFYNNISAVFDEYSKKFNVERLSHLWKY